MNCIELGSVMDVENRPIEGATITDDSSSSVATSYHNGTYKLSVREGEFIVIYT